jgi:hypothetical protein
MANLPPGKTNISSLCCCSSLKPKKKRRKFSRYRFLYIKSFTRTNCMVEILQGLKLLSLHAEVELGDFQKKGKKKGILSVN